MLNSDEYTIWDNSTIIIHSNVNKIIDFNLIYENIDKIIFSNYNNVEICIQTNDIIFNTKQYSKFNQQIILTDNLTHLTFGMCFNKPIILTNNLTHLTFGCDF